MKQKSLWWSSAKVSFQTTGPLLPSAIFFGMIFGFTGADAGLPLFFVSGMSYIIFAGSAQFITVLLIIEEELITAIVITAIIVNLRHALYSAVLKEMFVLKRWQKFLWSYFIIDETFLVTNIVKKQQNTGDTRLYRLEYVFLASGIMFWTFWNAATIVGHVLYTFLSEVISFPGDFIIAASFIGYLVDYWIKYSEDRYILVSVTIGAIGLGYVLSSSNLLIVLMIIGSLTAVLRQYTKVRRK